MPLLAMATLCSAESHYAYLASAGHGEHAGLFLTEFNVETGQLEIAEKVAPAPHPFFLQLTATGSHLLAAYNLERGTAEPGYVVSYDIDPRTKKLQKRSQAETHGKLPLHLDLRPQGNALVVANYQTPTVSSVQVHSDGSLTASNRPQILAGSSIHPQRQAHSFPHSISFHPSGTLAYACDRGSDRIYSYRYTEEGLVPTDPPYLSVRPGSGPRHMAFHPDEKRAYVVNEIGGSVTTFSIDATTGSISEGPSYPLVPGTFHGENYSAEIALHPNSNYLYATNRGHDSISVFRVGNAAALEPIQNIPCGGQHPRYFAIDPTGKWLLCSNRHTDSVSIFSIDRVSGLLTATDKQLSIPVPLHLVFIR
ncbi:lactonase family protein [Pelagicoccus enzymogenes]|uniref:lactonase family protein n=1 Tax=Pelagicoccus enzymogenes TaxID=2773457 RepID=UPI0028107C0A|nr:lactonase family protein [Pelagicoccus enzymogenes]MDQ8198001.1 lactonase family protein [Pelagicoccus enzymogenes]